ncbi:MAG: guanylate kinase [Gammaproteobacteria bacterium]|nr:guanylate kinase [Gammaproteobacteria bacterium]
MSTLYIICAPSGAGKTSLVAAAVASLERVEISVSHTTRPMRPGEKEGINYHFVNTPTFQSMITHQDFLEHALVFDNHYGTSRSFVAEKLKNNIDVILEIDWQGAQQITNLFQNTVSIFILPPSMEILSSRLRLRGQDSAAVIEKRLAEARHEIQHYQEFDYLVVNDDFSHAVNDLKSIITAHRLSLSLQKRTQASLIRALLA